jgi:glutaredoxin 3
MAPVTIYTTALCGYCARAKALLGRKGVPYEEIDISMVPGAREEMLRRAHGKRTVPQIFIGETHVGGCDDLIELDRRGDLLPMLRGAAA